jgi:hypothetical protein
MLIAYTTKARRSTLGLGITQASKSTHSSLRCATWDLRYLMSELVHHTKLNGTARMSMFRFRNGRAALDWLRSARINPAPLYLDAAQGGCLRGFRSRAPGELAREPRLRGLTSLYYECTHCNTSTLHTMSYKARSHARPVLHAYNRHVASVACSASIS